jgi:uncharacterized phage protein (TIGR01671 family)
MREIKFRAWHETNKKMVYFNPKKAFKDVYIGGHLLRLMKDKSKFLMQFTGLKDKNGIEIYECDILFSGLDAEIVVEWSAEGACWSCKDAQNGEKYGLLSEIVEHYSVVGNIYENPELLKNKAEL